MDKDQPGNSLREYALYGIFLFPKNKILYESLTL